MNTTELVDAVAEANDLSKAKAKEVVNSVLAAIIDAAKRGEEVAIVGFGVSLRRGPRGLRSAGRCLPSERTLRVVGRQREILEDC